MMKIEDLSREELLNLLNDFAKNWLAHDGLWFRAVEDRYGIETALDLDRKAWEKFTVIEAGRIMKRLNMKPGGGIPALIQALGFRLYSRLNIQDTTEVDSRRCVFHMKKCRVQEARMRQGLPPFPCKSVGIIEYSLFAKTIDPRIETRCLVCPPDPLPEDIFCSWEFTTPE